jgi:hypothetical protein
MSGIYPSIKSEEKFDNAQRRAFIRDVLAVLTRHHPKDLLSYQEVRVRLHALDERAQGTQMIELDKIIGSVGRYRDFTREFLPRAGANRERWKRLDAALNRLEYVPPIEVYRIGDVYFVKDGNHRVSVARANGLTHIEAFVTEVRTKVPLTPDVDLDDLIIKQEYADFLERTRLDELRPEQHIEFTTLGRYQTLLDHIAVHRHFLGLEWQREFPYEEAVTNWYDYVYRPAAEIIREKGILDKFPGRTEADLYVWLMDHLWYLQEAYGRSVSLEEAAATLPEPETSRNGLARLTKPMVGPLAKAAQVMKETVEEVVKETVDKASSRAAEPESHAPSAEESASPETPVA